MFDAMQLGQQVILVRIAVRYIVLTTRAVLFSILILHWATSLDRTHETAANSSSTPQGSGNMPKGSSTHAGLPRGPCVSTKIEAGKSGHDDDDDNMAMDSVLVKTHHVHEVEIQGRSGRASETNDLEFERDRHGSEGSMVVRAADHMV